MYIRAAWLTPRGLNRPKVSDQTEFDPGANGKTKTIAQVTSDHCLVTSDW